MSHHIEISSLLQQIPMDKATNDDEIQVGRDGDHIMKIGKAYGRQKQQTNKSLEQRLMDLNESSTKSCTISKLNVALTKSNPDAYVPKLISIGPYHKNNSRLSAMEKFKLRYLERFLRRKDGLDVKSCISELENLKYEALQCYDDIDDFHSTAGQDFVEMLLLDGCFVVEYIREFLGMVMVPKGEDKIINSAWMESLVDGDLLLLENQIPFFVLAKLYEMTEGPTEGLKLFISGVILNFVVYVPKKTPKFVTELRDYVYEIKHLLQVLHKCCCPPIVKSKLRKCWCPPIVKSKLRRGNEDPSKLYEPMRSATKLHDAGVHFSSVGKIYRKITRYNAEDCTSLFDIEFDNGLMEIPCFEVANWTEAIIRNLIAYEQHAADVHPKYFSDYVVFMELLIKSVNDVKLLRGKGIISYARGSDLDDEGVAIMFKRLREGVLPSATFLYKRVHSDVVEYCEKPWNSFRLSESVTTLRKNYCSNTWVTLSTAAAIILLLLTFAQTVLAFITTLK